MPRKSTDLSMSSVEKDDGIDELKETLLAEVVGELEQSESVSVVTDNIPKRYIANLYQEREPLAKDIFAGSYVYWDSTNNITWEALTPQYSTDLELLSQCDILVSKEGQSYLISRWENPKEWLQNLPWATLGERYICKDVLELYETE